MKKILLALGLASGIVTTTLSQSVLAQQITMGTEGAYAPFNYIDDNGNLAGFEIELGNALCARAELDCVWVTNEWDTIIPNLLAGNYDTIIAGMSITAERQKTIAFTEQYYPPEPSKYVANSNTRADWNNPSGLVIGVQGATIQAAYAQENWGANNTIKSYETGEQSLADLAAGAVDVVLADGSFLAPVVKASNGAIVFVGEDVLIGGGIGIGTRKGDTALRGAFNAAIAKMKADGSLNRLLNKYFGFNSVY